MSSECREGDADALSAWFVLSVLDARHIEHTLGGLHRVRLAIFVRYEDDAFDTTLNDQLRAIVAGKEHDVHCAACARSTVFVQDRVHFCVAYERVFGGINALRRVSSPRQLIVAAAPRKAVIANAHDALLLIHNARTDLRRRVFAAHRGQHRHREKVLRPRKVIRTRSHRRCAHIHLRFCT